MKTEPLKEWLFNPACSNCMQNFHKTQKAVAWLKEQLKRKNDEIQNRNKENAQYQKGWAYAIYYAQIFIDEAFAGVEGK